MAFKQINYFTYRFLQIFLTEFNVISNVDMPIKDIPLSKIKVD